jgi:hypothetical protein
MKDSSLVEDPVEPAPNYAVHRTGARIRSPRPVTARVRRTDRKGVVGGGH